MAVYMIFIREEPVRDPEAMAKYSQLNRENAGAFDLTPLVVYGDIKAVEGEAPDGIVMLRFDTADQARAWYDSPAYQQALPHRLQAADYRVMIVQGL